MSTWNWIRRQTACRIGQHRYRLDSHHPTDPDLHRVKCLDCRRRWAMNDRMHILVPWDNEFQKLWDEEAAPLQRKVNELERLMANYPTTGDSVKIDIFNSRPTHMVWVWSGKAGKLEHCMICGWIMGAWENENSFLVCFPTEDGRGWQTDEAVEESHCFYDKAQAEIWVKDNIG